MPEGRGFWIDPSDLGLEWHAGDLNAGDALLFHAFTIHAGQENRTDRLRLSCDFRFHPLKDPVSFGMLQVHRGIASWDQLYALWPADEPKYYWRDLPVITGKDVAGVDELRRAGRSRLFEVAES